MKSLLKGSLIGLGVALVALSIYAYSGWRDAASSAPELRERARALTQQGQGATSLSVRQRGILIMVEDPAFETHNGTDFSTPGAGLTTITQSLSKRLAFATFRPGIGKIRQTSYAISLEKHLTKDEIMTLALATAQMGPSETGWVVGFHKAADVHFDKPVSDLTEREFITLVATLIAPSRLAISRNDLSLQDRVTRIEKLVAGACQPENQRDVWLNGCA